MSHHERPLKSNEWVAQQLLLKLTSGELSPGDKLPSVVDLAAEYGVGRSTIREAQSALKAKGLLDIRQGGGTYVKSPPEEPAFAQEAWLGRADSLLQLLEVRKVLETGCAGLAAKHRTDDDLVALNATLREMEERLGDEAFGEQADVRLHERLAKATHNPMLAELMKSLSERLHESMRDTRSLWFYAEHRSASRLLEEHRSIVSAVASRDEALAASLMERHLAKVEQVLREKTGIR
ncbi:GntR family transcriptional regulator, transcriptional repressor for pyruvate dehydrogenase complex [Paenibacillus sp. UNC496MF]|uniref:FadR/GntR family transcriptional regulator n=1 Tax=Paenibacillus sp. UNC496MF TaxID=1502753 RepID=UPI0008F31BB1|nr:FadR/GntR family transcriptional regulator [Paenibacillus sp. UNC496MF]SFJ50809.1 GntR family transcriptional regulator, transcriptional repressor for pyruvate dehydrogenase complex [Paenibacillus sp. UNC496MF]